MKRRKAAPKVVRATEADELAALAYLNARDALAIVEAALADARARLEASLGDADELRGSGWYARPAVQLEVFEQVAGQRVSPPAVVRRTKRTRRPPRSGA